MTFQNMTFWQFHMQRNDISTDNMGILIIEKNIYTMNYLIIVINLKKISTKKKWIQYFEKAF